MTVALILPARLGSTRLPRKLLRDDTGRPLVAYAVERALAARDASKGLIRTVIVATDNEQILQAARAAGAEARMTRSDHASGTDRIAEVAATLKDDVVVNVQADEPEARPEDIVRLAGLLSSDETAPMATLASPADEAALADPNVVKVVLDRGGYALYFSRAPIPFERDRGAARGPAPRALRHIGMYAYRRPFLLGYGKLPASPLEQIEKLEQLRALEAGHRIRVAVVAATAPGIDTEEDYRQFVKRITAARKGGA